jgi:hypothetical protein
MNDDARRATAAITRHTLAIADMREVADVARLLTDLDPDINLFFGSSLAEMKAYQRGGGGRIGEALARRAESIHAALHDVSLRAVIETGLIVTYARSFTRGDGHGFPLSADDFVPPHGRDLHERILVMRRQAHAHTDDNAAEDIRRSVEYRDSHPSGWSVTERGPRRLTADELGRLAPLADEIIERLAAARDEARDARLSGSVPRCSAIASQTCTKAFDSSICGSSAWTSSGGYWSSTIGDAEIALKVLRYWAIASPTAFGRKTAFRTTTCASCAICPSAVRRSSTRLGPSRWNCLSVMNVRATWWSSLSA